MADDPELFHGTPIALQLVRKYWQDESLVDAAKLVEAAIR